MRQQSPFFLIQRLKIQLISFTLSKKLLDMEHVPLQLIQLVFLFMQESLLLLVWDKDFCLELLTDKGTLSNTDYLVVVMKCTFKRQIMIAHFRVLFQNLWVGSHLVLYKKSRCWPRDNYKVSKMEREECHQWTLETFNKSTTILVVIHFQMVLFQFPFLTILKLQPGMMSIWLVVAMLMLSMVILSLMTQLIPP